MQPHINPLDCRKDIVTEPLYVVTCITNPMRFWSRYELYHEFEKRITDSGAILYTIEAAYGERQHAVTCTDNPRHIQLRMKDELWHKENLLNLAIQRLPADWKYVAWIDADIQFARPDWATETLQQLQRYDVLQLFREAIDLGPEYQTLKRHFGYVWSYQNGVPRKEDKQGQYCYTAKGRGGNYFHPGFAWAARRSALDALGGLLDVSVLGSADNQMANAFYGMVDKVTHRNVSKGYMEQLLLWQDRATRYIRENIGYLDGTIVHFWHGKKRDRRYIDRWKILVDEQYDPEFDLKRDTQGLWQLTDRSVGLRDKIRGYFKGRNEDSVDIE